MGVGDGVCSVRCCKTSTTIVPACTCLYSLHLHTKKRQHDIYTIQSQHQGDRALLELSARKPLQNQKVSHHTLLTQDKLSISNSTEWLVVLIVGPQGHQRHLRSLQGAPQQISNLSLTHTQDALTGSPVKHHIVV